MFRNYFVLAVRNFLKDKLVSTINLVGISIAVAFGMLAVVFAYNELTYDLFHANSERIYRIRQKSGDQFMSRTAWPLGPAIASEVPNAMVVRIFNSRGSVAYGERSLRFRVSYVDPSFLNVFSFPMAVGDTSMALADVRSIVITEKVARKMFPGVNPVGKVVTLNENEPYTVTGVLSRLPENSSISFDCLVPADAADAYLNSWVTLGVRTVPAAGASSDPGESLSGMLRMFPVATTFVLLPEYLKPKDINDRLSRVVEKMWGRQATVAINLSLQPLSEVHFDQHTEGAERSTNPVYIFVFSGIALIVIAISCVNFSALAIGRSFLRTTETGVRQIFGARRFQFVSQYLVESALLALLAFLVGLGLVGAVLPSFNSLMGTNISLYGQLGVTTSLSVLLLTPVIGLLAGLYPALALSRLQPADIISAQPMIRNPGSLMWLMLVFQLAMSMVLMISTLAMKAQLDYIVHKNPGFRTDGVILVETGQLSETSPDLVEAYVERLATYPIVTGVARGRHPLSNRLGSGGFVIAEGRTVRGVETIGVDYGFLKTLRIAILEGRDFSKLIPTDREAVIINQALMRRFGWENASGKYLDWNDNRDVAIVGVVRDFHFRSLHEQVRPGLIFLEPEYCDITFVLSTSNEDRQVLDILRKEWNEIAPSQPFQGRFLEDDLKNQYKEEKKWLDVIQLLAFLALGLACFGTFGVTGFSVARRTKEIGIRKVFGAPIPRLMARLSIDYIKILALASIFAGVIAYLSVRQWLQNFVYRIDLIEPIIIGAVLTFVFVMLTVSYKTYRSATANPADTLRHK